MNLYLKDVLCFSQLPNISFEGHRSIYSLKMRLTESPYLKLRFYTFRYFSNGHCPILLKILFNSSTAICIMIHLPGPADVAREHCLISYLTEDIGPSLIK